MCTTSGPSFNPDLVHCFDNVAAMERPKKLKFVHDENYPLSFGFCYIITRFGRHQLSSSHYSSLKSEV